MRIDQGSASGAAQRFYALRAGQSFVTSREIATPATLAQIQLRNPAGSGVFLYITHAIFRVGIDMNITVNSNGTAFAVAPGQGANQLLGGAASAAVVDSRDSASAPGTEIGRFSAAAVLANIDFVDYFLKIPPGSGVVFAGATAGSLLGAFLEWVELPL